MRMTLLLLTVVLGSCNATIEEPEAPPDPKLCRVRLAQTKLPKTFDECARKGRVVEGSRRVCYLSIEDHEGERYEQCMVAGGMAPRPPVYGGSIRCEITYEANGLCSIADHELQPGTPVPGARR